MDLNALAQIVKCSTDSDLLLTYGKDWSVNYPAKPSAVVFPQSEDEIMALIQWARQQQVGLVPSGGRTGLSSAATATNGEVVVSFDQLNKILEFNPIDRTLRVQAGVITEQVQQVAREKGLYFPVDFAATGSSQIGGNVATNAGGVHVIRYGLMRDWVSGMKVITGSGKKLHLSKSLVKNATGYDLKNLFIGSEGTLGFITEIELKLTTPPANTTVVVLGMEILQRALDVYRHFSQHLRLSACEFFSQAALDKVVELHQLSRPFASEAPYYLLLEIEHTEAVISEQLGPLFDHCFAENWVNDGVISQSPQQAKSLWKLRENISESLAPHTPYKNDVSVRISQVAEFCSELQQAFAQHYQGFEVILFGHIGDGNVHVNILKPPTMAKADFLKTCHRADSILFTIVQNYGGAVSAEHGVGLVKKAHLHFSRSADEIELMRGIKKVFDPDGIMNPGKIFDL